jgi:PAT family beta-lactamase induction signal transducer AmpG
MILVGMMAFFSNFWSNSTFVTGFIIAFYILTTFNTIAIFATAMRLCWKRVAATQFTLYMAISNLGLALGAAIVGPLAGLFNWKYVILSYILFVSVMFFLLRYINFDKHQLRVDALENKFHHR